MISYSGFTFFYNNCEIVMKIFIHGVFVRFHLYVFDKDFKCTSLYFTSLYVKYNKIEVEEWAKKKSGANLKKLQLILLLFYV